MRDARDEWIEKEYLAAIFALKVEHERDSANYEVASYAGKAYEALCNGYAEFLVDKIQVRMR